MKKRQRTITATRNQEDNKSKASNSLFPSEMIAMLKSTQSIAYKTVIKHTPPPHKQWEQEYTAKTNNKTAPLERTAAKATGRGWA